MTLADPALTGKQGFEVNVDDLLSEFQSESKSLIGQLIELLEEIESDYSQHKRLENYGQIVDRIMGAAKSLEILAIGPKAKLDLIGNYSEIGKTVAYKASQVHDNPNLFTLVVAFLMDATEMLKGLIDSLADTAPMDIKSVTSKTFLDRLYWLSQQFGEGLRGTLDSGEGPKKISISELLKNFGN